jgi:branched-chain amino acid transport system permease protein
LSVPLVLVFFFLFGVLVYRFFFSTMIKQEVEDKIKNSMLVAFGLALLFENLVILGWTPNHRTVEPFYQGSGLNILRVRLPYVGLGSILLAIVSIYALHLFMKKTYLGKAIRATTQNWESAMLMGINVHYTYAVSMAIGTALAAVAGVFVILNRGIDPTIGMEWTIKALIITILSGTGNIGGIFVCGLFFGVMESICSMFTGLYYELIGLALFLAILIVKPQGLFGKG